MKLKVKLRRFIARNFNGIVDFYFSIKLKLKSFNNEPILIITPGKVGSSSVYKTLKSQLPNPVYHIHQFSEKGIKGAINRNLNSQRKSIPLHLIISKHLRKKVLHERCRVKVVVIVREPISRVISSFFQNTEKYKKQIEDKSLNINTSKAKEIIKNQFNEDICGEVEFWFKEEIEGNFGIDVFSKAFDLNNKSASFSNDNCDLLLMRMEDLNDNFHLAFKSLISTPKDLKLINTNEGNKKFYADAYSEVKKDLDLSKEVIDKIVSSKYFDHFYKSRKQEIIDKWLKT